MGKNILWIRGGEVSRFPSKIFCFTVPKNAVGERFSLSLLSGIEKVWIRGWGEEVSQFSVENYLSHSAEKLPAPVHFSPKYKYFDQLLQTIKNKRTVLILVFKEFLQTLIRSMISVLYAKGYHDFPLKNFCLTVPKNWVEEPFCVSENFWYRKMLGIREGAGITIFCQNCFVSLYRKTS